MRDTFVQTFKDKSDESGISADNYEGDKINVTYCDSWIKYKSPVYGHRDTCSFSTFQKFINFGEMYTYE